MVSQQFQDLYGADFSGPQWEGFGLPQNIDPWANQSMFDMMLGSIRGDRANLASAEQDRWSRFGGGMGMIGQGLEDFLGAGESAIGEYESNLGFLRDLGDQAGDQVQGLGGEYQQGIADANADMMNQLSSTLTDFTSKFEQMMGQMGGEVEGYKSEFGEKFGDVAKEFGESAGRFQELGEEGAERLQEWSGVLQGYGEQAFEMAESFMPQVEEWISGNLDKAEKWRNEVGDWAEDAMDTVKAAQNQFELKTTAQAQAMKAGFDSQLADKKSQINGSNLPEQVKASLLQQTDAQAATAYQGMVSKLHNDHQMATFGVAQGVAQTQLGAAGAMSAANQSMGNLMGQMGSVLSYTQMNTANMAKTGLGFMQAGMGAEVAAQDLLMKGEQGRLAALQGELQALNQQHQVAANALSMDMHLTDLTSNWMAGQRQIQANSVMAAHQSDVMAQSEIFQASSNAETQGLFAGAQTYASGLAQSLSAELGMLGQAFQGMFSAADYFSSYQAHPVSLADMFLGMSNYEAAFMQNFGQSSTQATFPA
tara:strand:- start:708 stop:2315 length:1608 start_codon:yes stop_codon:yes gene_type:complete